MTAYWISTYLEVTDPDKLAAYADLAFPALTGAGGAFIARGAPVATYEAAKDLRSVIIEFPSAQAAIDAHDSEAYQEALRVLDGGAVRDIRIVPGTDEA